MRHGGATSRRQKVWESICVPQNEASNVRYVLANDARSVGFCRFTAGFAEPDPEGGSVFVGGRQEEVTCEEVNSEEFCLVTPSLTSWSGVLTVCVAVDDSSGPTREDTGGGFRAVDCVPRWEGATAPLLARSVMVARSVALAIMCL